MDVEKVKQYKNKKVVLILKNGFKVTTTIPEFEGNSFDCKDKYEKAMSIECDMISLIIEEGRG
jgi:hypothetical protein